MAKFIYVSSFACEAEVLWKWLKRAGVFSRLQPPWMKWKPVRIPKSINVGERVAFKFKMGPFWVSWEGEHTAYEEGQFFQDRQTRGPFRKWVHTHRIEKTTTGCRMIDEIDFELPIHGLVSPLIIGWVRKDLNRLFQFRETRLRQDLERYAGIDLSGRVVLVTGNRGFVGSRLVHLLNLLGAEVRGLTRTPRDEFEFGWDLGSGTIDEDALDGVDTIIHLAGSNIAEGRWTDARKDAILESRIGGTKLLFQILKREQVRLKKFISASGVNYYDPDGKLKGEMDKFGDSFLAEVCRQWEYSANHFQELGAEVSCVRTGVVLDVSGGALAKMKLPFSLGIGGPLGSGNQGFPWIGLDDLCDLYVHLILDDSLVGPVNAVSKAQITQKQFAKAMGRVLRRPAFLPAPAFILKAALGEMAEELLLSDLKIEADVMSKMKFKYRFNEVESLLRFNFGKPRK